MTTKRAAIYCRVSTADQHPETQLYDLPEMAKQCGYDNRARVLRHDIRRQVQASGPGPALGGGAATPVRCGARCCV